jgi:hypothetical protein
MLLKTELQLKVLARYKEQIDAILREATTAAQDGHVRISITVKDPTFDAILLCIKLTFKHCKIHVSGDRIYIDWSNIPSDE